MKKGNKGDGGVYLRGNLWWIYYNKYGKQRDCSRATGFIQLVHDEVMQGFVDGLRLELHATYPAQDAH